MNIFAFSHPFSAGQTLDPDCGPGSTNCTATFSLASFSDDLSHRLVTDVEKNTWDGKQDSLSSGINIKTINGTSILGSGNIFIAGGSGGNMDYPTAGIANSNGSGWGTSYGTSGSGSTLALTNSPTFTGTVSGITPAMVGLGNVPNLSFSGSNTGDETLSSIKTKLGITTLSGSNTGDNAVNSLYSSLATSKQDALSGTGFVKISGSTISYDNSTYVTGTPWTSMGYITGTPWTGMGYLTSYTETDPIFSAWNKSAGISITKSQVSDFPTQLSQFTNNLGNYGGFVTGTPWTAMGYLTSFTETDPTISAWAKAGVKPTYTATEVGLGNVPNLSFSGSNTGDETLATIKTKLGITTLSGSNTGDETTATIQTKLGSAASGSDGYLSGTDWSVFNNKQDALVSGMNIKTINGTSILGSGNIFIAGGSGGNMDYPTAGIANSNGSGWGTSYGTSGSGSTLALTNSPTFTGTVSGITASMVGLGNVPNLSFSGSNTGDETTGTIQTKLGTASTSTSGYLTSTDWNTFNNKQPAGSYVTGTPWTSMGYVTGTPWTSMGYVTGTPWTGMGYLTNYTETDPIFSAWNKSAGISITKSQVSDFPTQLSQFTNNLGNYGGFVTGTPWTAMGYLTSFTETDPTISAWAKAGTKPSYTATEVGLGNVTNESKNTMFSNPTFTGTTNLSNVSITGSIIPTVDNTYNLGSATNMWHSIYVGPGSLYVNGQKVLQTDISNSVVISADSTQNLVMKTTGGGNIELNPASGGGAILLKSNVTLTGGKTFRTSDLSPIVFSDGISSPNFTTSVTNGSISITPNGIGNTYVTTGNFGIGTTTGLAKLSINGGLHVGGDSDPGDNNILADGNISAAGTISGSNISGSNTGDETTLSIQTKLGAPWTTMGYLTLFTETDPTISAWAKAGTKPAYTATEVGLGNVPNLSFSGSNTGDETLSTIKTKLGAAALGSDGYLTDTDWSIFNAKQSALVSGVNIKTINGISLLGSGDIAISGAGGDVTGPSSSTDNNIAFFNGTTGKIIKDSGITISGVNTGDETLATIKTKLGITTLSGSNTGDETTATIQTKLGIASTSTAGYLISTDWNTFNNKQPAGSYLTSFTETDPTISAWAKAGVKPTYTATEVGLGNVPNLSFSGSNTGDETTATIKTKLGITTLSGSNTGDQNLSGLIPYTGGTSDVDLGVHNLTVDTNSLFVDSVNHKVGIGTTSPTQALSFDGTTSHTIWMERNTTAATAGQGMIISSGGAIAGTADLAGGDLTLKSGISTGTGSSAMHFFTATAGVTAVTDRTPTEKMTILGNGNVGIGTTNPGDKLEIINSSNSGFPTGLKLTNSNSSGASGFTATNNDGSGIFFAGVYGSTNGNAGYPGNVVFSSKNNLIMGSDAGVTSGGTHSISFLTGGYVLGTQTRMTIDAIGNVGVGTTSPTSILDIRGTSPVLALRTAVFGGNLPFTFSQDNTTGYANIMQGANYPLTLGTNGVVNATLNTTGGLSLAPTASTGSGARLSWAGSLNTDARMDFGVSGRASVSLGYNYSGSTNIYGAPNDYAFLGNFQSLPLTIVTNATPRMTILGDGSVGIGTTTPLSKLSINGGLHVGGDSDAGDNNILADGTITATGDIIASTLTASKVVFTDASKHLTSTGIGTSSQFIKGDGSLDSSTYLTTASAGSTYVPYTGGTSNVYLGAHNLTVGTYASGSSGVRISPGGINISAAGQIQIGSIYGSYYGTLIGNDYTSLALYAGYGPVGSGTIGSTVNGGASIRNILDNGSGGASFSGSVGIGTATPLSKLSINGGLHVGGDSDAGDNNILADGTITAIGALSASNFSGSSSGTNTGDNAVNSLYSGLATSKQDALSGTGFIKISGTTISYDNSTYVTGTPWTSMGYLTSFTETDPTISAWAKAGVKPTYTATEVGLGNVPNLSFSGSNTGDETLATIKTKLGAASSGVDGYITGTDWSTFNNKISSQWTTTGSDIYYNTGRTFIGATSEATSSAKLYVAGTTAANGSSSAIAGILGGYTFNPTAGGVQVGNRFVVTNNPTSTANTSVAEMIRIVDNTSLANLVRGLDITSNAGSNTAGTNTGIRASGATFGIQGTTTALAGGVSVPAAIYGENTGTTQGDVLRLYSNTVTSAHSFATFYQDTSAYSGTGLMMNFATGSGSFSGNFADFQKNNTSMFKVTNGGVVSMGLSSTAATSALCSSLANGTSPTADTAYEIRDCSSTPVADYAEMYPVEKDITYGDIVMTGSNIVNTYDVGPDGSIDWTKIKGNTSKLVKSNASYQNGVIGIVSDNHSDFSSVGYNIKKEDNPMPIALNGRVPVKVSPNSDPIKAGDYLTTSSAAGMAQKAMKSGFVIGKALEDWSRESGKNTVMIFVEQGYYQSDVMSNFVAETTFNGLTFFNQNVNFAKSVTFNDVAEFAVPPLFNSDTAGFAIIKAGSDRVDVVFDKPYVAQPVVSASITFEDGSSTDDQVKQFFGENISYVVTNKSSSKFTIRINKVASSDIRFSWIALAVKDPKIFESVIDGLSVDLSSTTVSSSSTAVAAPTNIVDKILQTNLVQSILGGSGTPTPTAVTQTAPTADPSLIVTPVVAPVSDSTLTSTTSNPDSTSASAPVVETSTQTSQPADTTSTVVAQ